MKTVHHLREPVDRIVIVSAVRIDDDLAEALLAASTGDSMMLL